MIFQYPSSILSIQSWCALPDKREVVSSLYLSKISHVFESIRIICAICRRLFEDGKVSWTMWIVARIPTAICPFSMGVGVRIPGSVVSHSLHSLLGLQHKWRPCGTQWDSPSKSHCRLSLKISEFDLLSRLTPA